MACARLRGRPDGSPDTTDTVCPQWGYDAVLAIGRERPGDILWALRAHGAGAARVDHPLESAWRATIWLLVVLLGPDRMVIGPRLRTWDHHRAHCRAGPMAAQPRRNRARAEHRGHAGGDRHHRPTRGHPARETGLDATRADGPDNSRGTRGPPRLPLDDEPIGDPRGRLSWHPRNGARERGEDRSRDRQQPRRRGARGQRCPPDRRAAPDLRKWFRSGRDAVLASPGTTCRPAAVSTMGARPHAVASVHAIRRAAPDGELGATA